MKEERNIARSAGKVGLLTLVSRILGLIRDAVVAAFFHKSATDVFYVAFTIPNVLRQLLAEGALSASFIPVFTEYRQQRTPDEVKTMLRNVLGAALMVFLLVTAIGVFFAPWFVRLFAYGFVEDTEKFSLAISLTRINFFFIIFVGLTALAMGVLNTARHFAAPAAAPIVLNIGIIVTIVTVSSLMSKLGLPPITAVAIGVLVGGAGQLLLQMPFLSRQKMLVLPSWNLKDEGVRRVGRLMLPGIYGLAIYQINIIISRQLASFLDEGAISYLYYSQRLIEFPMGIIAVAMATASLPALSVHASSGEMEKLKQTYRYTLCFTMFIILPAIIGMAALALPLTSVLFQRGNFSAAMAQQTAWTLEGFLVGLWAGAGVRQTVPVYYAMQDTKTPVKVATLSLIVYAISALLMYRPWGTTGLALAVACSSITNFLTLLLILRRRLGPLGIKKILSSVARATLAASLAGLTAKIIALGGQWELGGAKMVNYFYLFIAVFAAIFVYFVMSWLLRSQEFEELRAVFRRRLKPTTSDLVDGKN